MLELFIDKHGDPERATLRAVIEAQAAYERGRAARSCMVHLLAAAGVVIWIEAIWPDLLDAELRLLSLVLFGGALFAALRTVIEEKVRRRRFEDCLKARECWPADQRAAPRSGLR